MAIVKTFNNNSIYVPGAYSKHAVDNAAGSPLGANDVLFLLGESTKGAPGSTTGIVEYSASRIDSLIATYGAGPLVDCAVASLRPSKTPGVGAPGRFLVYKTNASVQASATLVQSANNMYTVKGRAYGVADNNYSIVVAAGSTGNQKTVSITELSGTTESLGENDANIVLNVEYTGNATTAVLVIAGASRAAQTLATTLAGDQSDGSTNIAAITLANYTMKELVDLINSQTGYTATLETATELSSPATDLDLKTSTSIKGGGGLDLYKLKIEILNLINTSTRVIATEATNTGGVPDNQTLALTGGAQGASTNAYFSTGVSTSLAQDYNVVLPCISRDSTTDIADADAGFTDAASTYTIATVLAAVGSHLTLRGNTKNRKEAQAFAGFRNATFATCETTIAALNDYNIQCAIQDLLFVNAAGETVVGHPHVYAAMCAGIRLGTAVGEPLTHKYLNTTKVGHFMNYLTLAETGNFNPGVSADDAIIAGILFSEKKGSGFRIVVDNTTYGIDSSFVYNRGSVIEASYYVFKTLRDTAESGFVGRKVSKGSASSIKNILRNKLRELNAPDVNIITSSDDAPEGFREDTFVVTVTGNTATIQIDFKPVSALDFAFFNFTLSEVSQSA